MDPRLKILIESIKRTHVSQYNSLFWTEFHNIQHRCYACKGNNPMPCAVLRAALELEKENENDESS